MLGVNGMNPGFIRDELTVTALKGEVTEESSI